MHGVGAFRLLCRRYVFHEVRVPLNTIRLGLDSMQQSGSLDSDTSFVVSCMDEAANTMADTLNDVLSYQKIEEGKVELVAGPFGVAGFLQAVAFGFEATLQAKRLALRTSAFDQVRPPSIAFDRLRSACVRSSQGPTRLVTTELGAI